MIAASEKRARLLLVTSSIAFVAVFNLVYEYYVAPSFSYFGCSYNPPPFEYLAVSWAVSIIPSLWLPTRFDRPSLFLFYVQYFTVFIPAVFMVYHSSKPELSHSEALELVLLMFAGLSIIQSFYRRPLTAITVRTWSARGFWWCFTGIAVAAAIYVVVILGSYFQIVRIEDIYDFRSNLGDIVEKSSGGRLISYAETWLSGFFLPFLFAVGAFARRRAFVVVVVVGYIVLFGFTGMKSILFFVPYIALIYMLLTRFKHGIGTGYGLAMTALLALTPLIDAIAPAEISALYLGVVPFRFFAVPALTIPEYFRHFQENPVTYLSHVTGISWLLDYPYDTGIPRVIGIYYYGNPQLNCNSGFWAGDGLAGFGPAGIIIMSVVCGVVFWIFDCIAKRHDPRFVAVALTFIGFSFSSTSLFTTLVTGGWLLLMFALLVMPNRGALTHAFRETAVAPQGIGGTNAV